jgi:hypothetical protein
MRRRNFASGLDLAAIVLLFPFVACAQVQPVPEILSCSGQIMRPAGAAGPLTATGGPIVHEWGTFTCLQNEGGEAVGGINADDEPVPEFVHRIARFLLLGPGANVPVLYQGAPHCHPDVTMRLETPVIYIYPGGLKTPFNVDVSVAFRGGWLSEYYPDADVSAPGVTGEQNFGSITPSTIGELHWRKLRVGSGTAGPKTASPVWLTPRAVNSADVTTDKGESERFLFYRGVGHVDSPLHVSRENSGDSLTVTANFPLLNNAEATPTDVKSLWLVEIRADKSCAFRTIEGFNGLPNDGKPHVVAKTPAGFVDGDFQIANLEKLTTAMRAALIADGLYAAEADALLNTWKLSYFQTPGARVFYLLPRAWTNQVLPLTISRDVQTVRSMVGRIELVTPHERVLLKQIAEGPGSDASFLRPRPPAEATLPRQPEPADYRAYAQLGRFGNALVLEELKRRPTQSLTRFVENYGLHGYDVPTN